MHTSGKVTENETADIWLDKPIHTDREIKSNKKCILSTDNNEQRCFRIHMSIPTKGNTSLNETDKFQKYKT